MKMHEVRVRFAPSPTGALHIGGVRTALYNYLFARRFGGKFILRIEDTDQARFVPGAEEYILEALEWLGLQPDEGPVSGGPYGPYRQSERRARYEAHALELVKKGAAYYAFDSPEELAAAREKDPNFKYGLQTRQQMRNSLTLSDKVVRELLDGGAPYTIRMKVPAKGEVAIQDAIRGEVLFRNEELDDKVILKGDGMPTYHLANIVDDRLMEITHVIRGEEWLPSTGHHVLLYQALGWADRMPEFAHLPLILKPDGKGKLSKRDGSRLGIPVFPLDWKSQEEQELFPGFREAGFLPEAVLNFLALLGWNPGTEQEIFSLAGLVHAFGLDQISKGGARFDMEKARWFNQQYLIASSSEKLAELVVPWLETDLQGISPSFLREFVGLMKERAVVLPDFWEKGYYFFEDIRSYDEKMVRKKWDPSLRGQVGELRARLDSLGDFTPGGIEETVKAFMESSGLKMGQVMPVLRLALTGTMQGPGVFEMMALLGKERVSLRLGQAPDQFDQILG